MSPLLRAVLPGALVACDLAVAGAAVGLLGGSIPVLAMHIAISCAFGAAMGPATIIFFASQSALMFARWPSWMAAV